METQRLEGQNTSLRSEIRQLHEERDQLTRIIRSHASVCPLTPRHSPLTVVRESPLLVVPLRESPLMTRSGVGACGSQGGCEGLTLVRESPLTTGGLSSAPSQEPLLLGGPNVRESPLVTVGATMASQSHTGQKTAETQVRGGVSGEKGKGCSRVDSQKLLRESPLLAALANLSSSTLSTSQQMTEPLDGAKGSDFESSSGAGNTGRNIKRLSKSPVTCMGSGVSSYPRQSPIITTDEGGETAFVGNTAKSGRRSSLLMQSPVMGGARPSVVMQSPALLVPPTRDSPVPLLIINPGGGAAVGAGIGGGNVMTSPLPPPGQAIPSSPVPMSSRPRKSPIALFRSNLSPIQSQQQHMCNTGERRMSMDPSPVLFGSPPKQSKHSIPPRLNLSGPKPVKPILPKPPSSSISSASSSASSSSFPCSSPRTPQSFLASPLPNTASPVSASGRPSHASPIFFGEGCFTPSTGKSFIGSHFPHAGEYGNQQLNKNNVEDTRSGNKSSLGGSDKLRQSPMPKAESMRQVNQSPVCLLEAMRQINQSPMRKPDVKRKLTQSPLCASESVKQHINQSPISHMEVCRQAAKSPAAGGFNSPSRMETSPLTVCDNNKNSSSSSARITQQSPVFFGSGKGTNPPLSAGGGHFLQPKPLPRSTHNKNSTATSLLTLLQRENPVNMDTSVHGKSSNAQTAFSDTNASNVFANSNANSVLESDRTNSVFVKTLGNNTTACRSSTDNMGSNGSSANLGGNGGSMLGVKDIMNVRNSNDNIQMRMISSNTTSRSEPNASSNHEVIDVDELDDIYSRERGIMFPGSSNNNALNTFSTVTNNNPSNTGIQDVNKTHEMTNVPMPFCEVQNTFIPPISHNTSFMNAPPALTTNDARISRESDTFNLSTVQDNSNTFGADRVFPDSPALPSPSLMLDDNALSLEEIERSAEVLESRDAFMDLLDIQALLELSADHNTNNSNANSNSNNRGSSNSSNSHSNIPPNTASLFQEGTILHKENERTAAVYNTNTTTGIVSDTNFNNSVNPMPKEDNVNSNNVGASYMFQNAATFSFPNQQMRLGNTVNTNSNFLDTNQPALVDTEVDKYAQILASFSNLQSSHQSSTQPAHREKSIPSTGVQQIEGSLRADGEIVNIKAQSKISDFDALSGFFVSSATSTIHHHPSQTQNSPFATLAPNQNVSYSQSNAEMALPPNVTGMHGFSDQPQHSGSIIRSHGLQISNQSTSFLEVKQNGPFSFGTETKPPVPQGKFTNPVPWQPLPAQSINLPSSLSQTLNPTGCIANSETNTNTPNTDSARIQAPSGFSTYKSRLRELLNAPSTYEVSTSYNTGGSRSVSISSAPTAGATPYSARELQANIPNTSTRPSLSYRFTPNSDENSVTSLGRGSIWEPPAASDQVQDQGTTRFEMDQQK
ncbi:hypothetical protein PoB_007703000 [Plakobranchus ocellatus]|uniref:Uncharacterized protein n=1 Tax=Plakobranchus ocellatus TaxID=259542 RepID=A0AAV4E2R5_9GAST|nr:hypothetical protein PoB_007703000 [Plakobranchus ocellatus]